MSQLDIFSLFTRFKPSSVVVLWYTSMVGVPVRRYTDGTRSTVKLTPILFFTACPQNIGAVLRVVLQQYATALNDLAVENCRFEFQTIITKRGLFRTQNSAPSTR